MVNLQPLGEEKEEEKGGKMPLLQGMWKRVCSDVGIRGIFLSLGFSSLSAAAVPGGSGAVGMAPKLLELTELGHCSQIIES